jgi:hypothetical protein
MAKHPTVFKNNALAVIIYLIVTAFMGRERAINSGSTIDRILTAVAFELLRN